VHGRGARFGQTMRPQVSATDGFRLTKLLMGLVFHSWWGNGCLWVFFSFL
jgi:hypothetical protein